MQTEQFKVTGMSCGGCVGSVKCALQKVEGVSDVDVSLNPGQAIVNADVSLASAAQILAAITKLGYQANLRSAESIGASV